MPARELLHFEQHFSLYKSHFGLGYSSTQERCSFSHYHVMFTRTTKIKTRPKSRRQPRGTQVWTSSETGYIQYRGLRYGHDIRLRSWTLQASQHNGGPCNTVPVYVDGNGVFVRSSGQTGKRSYSLLSSIVLQQPPGTWFNDTFGISA